MVHTVPMTLKQLSQPHYGCLNNSKVTSVHVSTMIIPFVTKDAGSKPNSAGTIDQHSLYCHRITR